MDEESDCPIFIFFSIVLLHTTSKVCLVCKLDNMTHIKTTVSGSLNVEIASISSIIHGLIVWDSYLFDRFKIFSKVSFRLANVPHYDVLLRDLLFKELGRDRLFYLLEALPVTFVEYNDATYSDHPILIWIAIEVIFEICIRIPRVRDKHHIPLICPVSIFDEF